MSAALSILRLDLRGIARDQVLAVNASMSVLITICVTLIGLLRGGDPAWARWFSALLALSVLSGPPSWGFLFGLLMVDEKDTGVRAALAVTPVSPRRMLLTRGLTSAALMVVWPLISVSAMNAAWRSLPVGAWSLSPLLVVLALGAPVTALLTAALADNKVEAMAIFKGINFLVLAPLALLLVPADAWWRWAFFLLPSAWGLAALQALGAGQPAGAWLLGALLYHLLLLYAAVMAYSRAVYKAS